MTRRYVRGPMGGPDDPRHGTRNGYANLGCRCDECTRAKNDYMLPYHRRIRAERRAQGLTAHGKPRKSDSC